MALTRKEIKARYYEKLKDRQMVEIVPETGETLYEYNKRLSRDRNKKYREENRNDINTRSSTIHREKNISRAKKHYEDNKELYKKRSLEYKKDNRGVVNAYIAKRKCHIKQATPRWADLEKIKEFYINCANISKISSSKYHVDHKIPLQCKYVCGLHYDKNLDIIKAVENLSKKNKFIPYSLNNITGKITYISQDSLQDLDKILESELNPL